MYSRKINGQKKYLGGSYVFSKHLMGPIKWVVGCPLFTFIYGEKQIQQFQTLGKGNLWKIRKNLTNQKLNKKREKNKWDLVRKTN